MRAATDRSIRFVFDSVADIYLAGRLDMPVEAVRWGFEAADVPASGRVLEVGAGGGQLTVALLEAGLDVVALEPGDGLRARAQERAPRAHFVASTFEDFEPDGRFDAVVSSNAFHWVDPDLGYARAAELAGAIVLLWNTPFPADEALHARVQNEVMGPRGSAFPDTLRFAAERYVSLILSLGHAAAQPDDVRLDLERALRAVVGDEPLELRDLVYVVAARAWLPH